MGIDDVVNSVKDFFESIFELFWDLSQSFEPTFEASQSKAIFLLIVALGLHFLDMMTDFNRGSMFYSFQTFYLFFSFLFFILTLPKGEIRIDNFIFSFLIGLLSLYFPMIIILISKYIPYISLLLIFTPIWPLTILFLFRSDIALFEQIIFWFFIFWFVVFFIYFYANMPQAGMSKIYHSSFELKDTFFDFYHNFILDNAKLAFAKFVGSIEKLKNSIYGGVQSYVKYNIDVAMGLDTQTTATTNQTKQKDYGLYIDDVYSQFNVYQGTVPTIYFEILNKGVNEKIHYFVSCRVGEYNGTVKNIDDDTSGLSLEGNLLNGDGVDYECFFPQLKNLSGDYTATIEVKVPGVTNSSLVYYVISTNELIKLRKKEKNFFDAYHFSLPKTVVDSGASMRTNLGFKRLPLIETVPNAFSIQLSPNWKNGKIVNITSLNLDFLKSEINLTTQKGEELPKSTTSNSYFISSDNSDFNYVLNLLMKGPISFVITSSKINNDVVSSSAYVSINYNYEIDASLKFSVDVPKASSDDSKTSHTSDSDGADDNGDFSSSSDSTTTHGHDFGG